ncbi:MAG: CRISPR-associated helicase Cas3' [Candidatus Bathyarchaeia archaeon]
MEKWVNPTCKLSHENKTISQHIQEVLSILSEYLQFYGIREKYFQIAKFLAEYHDAGKMHINWDFNSKEGHAHHSLEYILEKKIEYPEKNLDPVIKFLILKHHSSLSDVIGEKTIEYNGRKYSIRNVFNALFKEAISSSLSKMADNQFGLIIDVVDVFGLFKIADVCSAKGRTVHLKRPLITEDFVKQIVAKKLDEVRWNEQKTLSTLPNISMLKAYTGWGKTDVSLLFFKDKDVSKVFYLLPTTTAINNFFEKLCKASNGEVAKYFYFLDTELKEDYEKLSNIYFIENFTAPYNITTIDQFLLAFLQVGKYYTKRVMFRNSGLIVDEVHLLNPLMLDLLTFFIKKYATAYKLKILFMSATLPSALSKYLCENFEINRFLNYSEGYAKKRRVLWEYTHEQIENSIESIIREKQRGKKVLVIVNTVEDANNLGKKFENDYKLTYAKDFIVFHARTMYKDRKEKENWLNNNQEKPHITIATQVCEVSLDLSYDTMFAELASLPALVQRFGRVNRHGNKTEEINVYIFKPHVKDPQSYPYSESDLKISEEIIRELEGKNLRNEKQLIEKIDLALSYEELLSEITFAKRSINMKHWEDLLKFFYSFDVKDEKISQALNYRESFTTLVIPHPDCIEDPVRSHVAGLLRKDFSCKSFDEKSKLIAELKELAVPIPFWWLKNVKIEESIFPVAHFKDTIYNFKYGFHR